MKTIMVMFDSLNRHMLSAYGCDWTHTPNFKRLAEKSVKFEKAYVGSLPCMPARRELHTGRHNFLHRSWGPLEPFDFSMPRFLHEQGIHTHLITDHQHYMKSGGHNYHTQYTTWEYCRGQAGENWLPRPGLAREWNDIAGIHRSNNPVFTQDRINRTALKDETDWPQAQCFQLGLDFLKHNHQTDNWFLQIETFDPHEPFCAPQQYRDLYGNASAEEGAFHDWPEYRPVTETPETCSKVRNEYAALLSMCDAWLGRILDFMDTHAMWDDTMLIVNTDHGFLLGEQDWWGKSVMPVYEEISHIPLFIWDPRSQRKGASCPALVQTIDLAPTILDFFGFTPPATMEGRALRETLAHDTPVREHAIFGYLGFHANITDGHTVYMRSPRPEPQLQIYEYTLMSSKYNNGIFPADEWNDLSLHPGFSFTKGYKVLKIPVRRGRQLKDPATRRDYLFDLEQDPKQANNLADTQEDQAQTWADHLRAKLVASECPEELLKLYQL